MFIRILSDFLIHSYNYLLAQIIFIGQGRHSKKCHSAMKCALYGIHSILEGRQAGTNAPPFNICRLLAFAVSWDVPDLVLFLSTVSWSLLGAVQLLLSP